MKLSVICLFAMVLTGISVPAPSSVDVLPPDELQNAGTFAIECVRKPLKKCRYDWDTVGKTVVVGREERQSTSGPWSSKSQDISASFYILDIAVTGNATTNELSDMYVAGDYGNDLAHPTATIEKWHFVYPASVPGSPYVPLELRPSPQVQRTVVFSSSTLGRIRALDVNPDGNYIVFVTFETPTVYKIATSGGAATLLHDSSTFPQVSSIGTVVVRQHVVEGRMVQLLPMPKWQERLGDGSVFLLPDSDSNGVFDALQSLTKVAAELRGFYSSDSWVRPLID